MRPIEQFIRRPAWAPNDGAGAGGNTGAGAGDAAAAAAAAAATAAGAGGGAVAKWWETDKSLTAEERDWLTAKGLATDDPNEALAKALKGYRSAEQKLGRPADSVMDRPAKDQKLADWMKANAQLFGIPEKAEAYELEVKDLPEGVQWDKGLEDKFRTFAHENGVPAELAKGMVQLFAGHMGETVKGLETELQTTRQQLELELKKDWGDQYAAKVTLAKQAVDALAEKAGFDQKALTNLNMALSEKVGDPAVMRLFAAIGEMMGEDSLAGMGKGNTTLATTPAEARAEIAKLRAADGEYTKALQASNRPEIARLQARIETLTRIAAG